MRNAGKISGTLLIDPTNQKITFKATASSLQEKNNLVNPGGDAQFTSVVLPDATYTVTLVSGSGTNGFLDSLGEGLDGAEQRWPPISRLPSRRVIRQMPLQSWVSLILPVALIAIRRFRYPYPALEF